MKTGRGNVVGVSPLDIVKAPTGVFEPSRPHYRHKRHPLFAGLFSALCNQIHTPSRIPLLRKTVGISDLFLSLREKRILARERKSLHFSVALTPPPLYNQPREKAIGWIETVDDDPPPSSRVIPVRLRFNYLPPPVSALSNTLYFLDILFAACHSFDFLAFIFQLLMVRNIREWET